MCSKSDRIWRDQRLQTEHHLLGCQVGLRAALYCPEQPGELARGKRHAVMFFRLGSKRFAQCDLSSATLRGGCQQQR